MKEIILNRGLVTLVDDDDYDWLTELSWYAHKGLNTYYARSTCGILMHRIILRLTDTHIKGDHIDRNGLNNQKHNLRPSNCSQNSSNKKSYENSSSIYVGVHWNKKNGIWRAHIKKGNKSMYLGSFANEIEAAIAYDNKARKIHGEFANLNFP